MTYFPLPKDFLHLLERGANTGMILNVTTLVVYAQYVILELVTNGAIIVTLSTPILEAMIALPVARLHFSNESVMMVAHIK